MEDKKQCDNCQMVRTGPFVDDTCYECYYRSMSRFAEEAEWALTRLAPPEKMGEDDDACTVYEFIQKSKQRFQQLLTAAGVSGDK